MSLSYKLSMPKLGNVSASSLVKSASTLTNSLNAYNDKIANTNFNQNPTTDNLNTYISYLQGRVSQLNATGSIVDATKAISLNNEVNTAFKTNTTFNIGQISTQMLMGNASDYTKLQYLNQNVLQNPIVQNDPAMYSKYMGESYNLQQSIQLQAQTQQTAAESVYTANQTAIKAGYDNAVAQVKGAYNTILATFKDGGAAEVQSALVNFSKQYAPVLEKMGVKIPTGSQLNIAGVAQATMHLEAGYYQQEAMAQQSLTDPYGNSNPDVQAAVQKANDVNSDVTTLTGPNGKPMNLSEINQWVTMSQGTYPTATNVLGETTAGKTPPSYNGMAVEGYQVKNGQVIPQINNQTVSTYDALSASQKAGVKNTLVKLGFSVVGTSSGNLTVQFTGKTASWLGQQTASAMSGGYNNPIVTLVTTNHGKGFQFMGANGQAYGISLDNRGLAALYNSNGNGGWNLVHGEYGFNPKTTGQFNAAGINTSGPGNFFKSIIPTVGNDVANLWRTSPAQVPSGPRMTQRAGGGFNFVNASGGAISAATYAKLTNTPFRTLLQNMSNQGDAGARTVLGFVGNDFGYDPTKMNSSNAGLYNAETWGSGVKSAGTAYPQSATIPGLGNGIK